MWWETSKFLEQTAIENWIGAQTENEALSPQKENVAGRGWPESGANEENKKHTSSLNHSLWTMHDDDIHEPHIQMSRSELAASERTGKSRPFQRITDKIVQ